jgi:hypothetical protein
LRKRADSARPEAAPLGATVATPRAFGAEASPARREDASVAGATARSDAIRTESVPAPPLRAPMWTRGDGARTKQANDDDLERTIGREHSLEKRKKEATEWYEQTVVRKMHT